MRLIRLYQSNLDFKAHETFELNEDAYNHFIKVLRAKNDTIFNVFDGNNHEYQARLIDNKKGLCEFLQVIENNKESNLDLILAQVISKGDKMEYTLEKAVELGVKQIFPLSSIRCDVKLDDKRAEKKVQSWQKLVISSSEQSGRAFVPVVHPICSLNEFCSRMQEDIEYLTFDPKATTRLKDMQFKGNKICILIGPEGGFDSSEIQMCQKANFKYVSLGPRILRTQTAGLCALSIIGANLGDI